MCVLRAAAALMCFCALVEAQVSVTDGAIRAHLVNGKTTITLPVVNQFGQSVETRVKLAWIGTDEKIHGQADQTVALMPGATALEIPLPIGNISEPLTERLRYDVRPNYKNLTAFDEIHGMASLANIASYAFTLRTLNLAQARPGQPIDVRVIATHPVTGQPVSGVTVTRGELNALTDANGMTVLRIALADGEDLSDDDLEGTLGDFEQSVEIRDLRVTPGQTSIQLDKPIYQRGQTMHVRILAFAANGKAEAGSAYELKIANSDGDVEHAAHLKTSRFGIAATDWEIPANAKEGDYVINVEGEGQAGATRQVRIRAYELPTFKVTARAVKAYYLAGQMATLEVRADYLFGKPLKSGAVRITEGVDEKATDFANGRLDANGTFHTSFLARGAVNDWEQFRDRHFVAYVMDSTTNRTEQAKFDLRISKDSLHVYLAERKSRPDGERLYVTTYSPEGSAVEAEVQVLSGGKVVAHGRSNRYGIVRLDVGKSDGDVWLRASTNDGRHASVRENLWVAQDAGLWLSTTQTICRPGEAIRGELAAQRDMTVQLLAWNRKGQTVFSKEVALQKGVAPFEIPYDKDFGKQVGLAAIAGPVEKAATATVIFPGDDDLVLKAAAAQKEYAPGKTARLEFTSSAEAALGIAVVDRSVVERAATDQVFGRKAWFNDVSASKSLGGVMLGDLLHLDPAKIDAALELLAEVLAPTFLVAESSGDASANALSVYERVSGKSLKPFREMLDARYVQNLTYPKDAASYREMGDPSLHDLWLRPYDVRFSVEKTDDVMELWSSGPDKKAGTGDDFMASSIQRKWFARWESVMRDALQRLEDYPATTNSFLELLDKEGVHFSALRDPWRSPLRLQIQTQQDRRIINISSAGPGKKFGTDDDFVVCSFNGTYFAGAGRRIQKKIDSSGHFPKTDEDFRAAVLAAGVNIDALRDPWGHKYFVRHHADARYFDKVTFYTYREYGQVEETRKHLTPARHTMLTAELRSAGSDGRRDTADDFAVYRFFQVLEEPDRVEATTPPQQKALIAGTGMIAGTVTDATGAVMPNARITLNDGYGTRTSADGTYAFTDLPSGVYQLRFIATGFQMAEVANIPVKPDHVTKYDFVFQVGSVAQMITVSEMSMLLQTSSAEIVGTARQPISTPRVREYFPETLYWQPELVTDENGHAAVDVKLADTITTWRVAVIASTVDGRVSETETDVRAFQPFQADLDVPQVLTVGDQLTLPVPIRNYLNQAQTVTMQNQAEGGLEVQNASARQLVIGKDSSANALLDLRAIAPAVKAKLQISAVGSSASDAIVKETRIHLDGERMEKSVTNILSGGQNLRIEVAGGAIAGSVHGEVKLYPTILARLFEAVDALLQKPHGCGEQTISSAYPNLLVLKALKQAGIEDQTIEEKALKNLRLGYERLLGYQSAAGGFEYWHKEDPNAALTGYALRFLRDLKEFVPVDEEREKKAADWLARQPVTSATDGMSLEQLTRLAKKAADFSDPYDMAVFAIAAMDDGRRELADATIRRLSEMAQDEEGAAFWAIRANTPFHGWGRTGQVETTAIVISALAQWGRPELKPLIGRAVLFLLRNTHRDGVWGSGQATVRALTALLQTMGPEASSATTVEVVVNGAVIETIHVKQDRMMAGPMMVDVSKALRPGMNEVSLRGGGAEPLETQFNAEWYQPWAGPRLAKDFALTTKFSSDSARVRDVVRCAVTVSRPMFRGYGMMIAEVGLPPGVEVDRGSLEAALRNVDSYEVAPDHVTFYVWPQAKDVRFDFVFRPRFGMKAKMAESALYDYYNPDARMVLVPGEFTVR